MHVKIVHYNYKKFSIVTVKIRVVIHCNAVDKRVNHNRLNNKLMAVFNTKCAICNDAYKKLFITIVRKKFSIAIVQIKVVIHCNAADRKSLS